MRRNDWLRLTILAVAVAANGCSRGGHSGESGTASPPATTATDTSHPKVAGSKLAGTHWRLIEIQPSDPQKSATTPSDPTRYTLAFDNKGIVSVRLDCNRGAGPFDEKPSGGDAGNLTIGPLATTRVFCTPPSLGDRVGRDLAQVHAYRIANGQLSLALNGNGGTYLWAPDSSAR